MSCFINATHTDPQQPWLKRVGITRRSISPAEYNLLGNIYCNIGTICHLAAEYQLSYDIFRTSARKFQQANNTTAYYYALNDMAIEAAKMCNKDETLELTSQVDTTIIDSYALGLINMTKAILYINLQEYDSALVYANYELRHIENEPTGLLIKAQAFSYLNQKDSAVIYAKYIIDGNSSLENKDNAYYILQHDDVHIDKDSINQLAADRTDIITLLQSHQINIAQSIQLLINDINRKPYYGRIFFMIVVFVTFLVILFSVLILKRKLSFEAAYKREQVNQYVENVKKELSETISEEIKKKEQLNSDNTRLAEENYLLRKQNNVYKENNLRSFMKTYNSFVMHDNLLEQIYWKDYSKMCKIIDENFFLFTSKLKQQYNLSEQEIKLCVLVLFEYNQEQISAAMHYALNGIGKLKYRIAKKLGTTSKNLRNVLIENVIS